MCCCLTGVAAAGLIACTRGGSSKVDGQVIEDVGIAPHVFVTTGANDFTQGRDPVLDWSLHRSSSLAYH
jgi:hypothetical protein